MYIVAESVKEKRSRVRSRMQEDFLRSVSQRVGGGGTPGQDPSVGSGTQTRGHEGPPPPQRNSCAGPRNLIGPALQTKDLHAGRARESSICEACC